MTYQKRLYINQTVQNRGVFGRFLCDSSLGYRVGWIQTEFRDYWKNSKLEKMKKMRFLSYKENGVSFLARV